MTEIIRIDIMQIPVFTHKDGTTVYGDSDGETFYDPYKDIVYFPYCQNCKKLVMAIHKTCKSCGASLEKK